MKDCPWSAATLECVKSIKPEWKVSIEVSAQLQATKAVAGSLDCVDAMFV